MCCHVLFLDFFPVQGSLQVLETIGASISDQTQMDDFAPTVLPHLYQVFAEREVSYLPGPDL